MTARTIKLRTAEGVIEVAPDGDVTADEVSDSAGSPIDDAYVAAVVEQVRGRGRPSLSGAPGPSRVVQIRMDEATYASVKESASTAGVSASQWVRDAIRQRLNQAG